MGFSIGSRLEHFVSITQDDLDDLMVEAVKPWGTKVAAVMGHVDRSLKAYGVHDGADFDEIENRLRGAGCRRTARSQW